MERIESPIGAFFSVHTCHTSAPSGRWATDGVAVTMANAMPSNTDLKNIAMILLLDVRSRRSPRRTAETRPVEQSSPAPAAAACPENENTPAERTRWGVGTFHVAPAYRTYRSYPVGMVHALAGILSPDTRWASNSKLPSRVSVRKVVRWASAVPWPSFESMINAMSARPSGSLLEDMTAFCSSGP